MTEIYTKKKNYQNSTCNFIFHLSIRYDLWFLSISKVCRLTWVWTTGLSVIREENKNAIIIYIRQVFRAVTDNTKFLVPVPLILFLKRKCKKYSC